jgi:hypothetical protein
MPSIISRSLGSRNDPFFSSGEKSNRNIFRTAVEIPIEWRVLEI